jgi:hypothetical protein
MYDPTASASCEEFSPTAPHLAHQSLHHEVQRLTLQQARHQLPTRRAPFLKPCNHYSPRPPSPPPPPGLPHPPPPPPSATPLRHPPYATPFRQLPAPPPSAPVPVPLQASPAKLVQYMTFAAIECNLTATADCLTRETDTVKLVHAGVESPSAVRLTMSNPKPPHP